LTGTQDLKQLRTPKGSGHHLHRLMLIRN